MPGASRQGDESLCQEDRHDNDCCPHIVRGPAVGASGDVMINGVGALRVGDKGVHRGDQCCGSNEWECVRGSGSVFINGLPAVRLGDTTAHCGGAGYMTGGSGNVMIGG